MHVLGVFSLTLVFLLALSQSSLKPFGDSGGKHSVLTFPLAERPGRMSTKNHLAQITVPRGFGAKVYGQTSWTELSCILSSFFLGDLHDISTATVTSKITFNSQ